MKVEVNSCSFSKFKSSSTIFSSNIKETQMNELILSSLKSSENVVLYLNFVCFSFYFLLKNCPKITSVFRTQPKIYNGAFFAKIVNDLLLLWLPLVQISNKMTKKRCGICYQYVIDVVLVAFLLTWNIFHTFF